MQLRRSHGLRFRARGNLGCKLSEDGFQHLRAECSVFGFINHLIDYGYLIQRCLQHFLGNVPTSLLELHRSLIQESATLSAVSSVNGSGRTPGVKIFMGTVLKCKLGCPIPSSSGRMSTNQACLFDGVHCTPLMGELGAIGTFLFRWIWRFPHACVPLRNWWRIFPTIPAVHFTSPILKMFVHPLGIL